MDTKQKQLSPYSQRSSQGSTMWSSEPTIQGQNAWMQIEASTAKTECAASRSTSKAHVQVGGGHTPKVRSMARTISLYERTKCHCPKRWHINTITSHEDQIARQLGSCNSIPGKLVCLGNQARTAKGNSGRPIAFTHMSHRLLHTSIL